MVARTTLAERVARLSDETASRLSGETRETVEAVARRLREPLRIAVAGRIKAGKSTLVNALVGRLVAPTGVAETTRIVTWYRFAADERVELHLRDGRVSTRPIGRDTALPAELGADPDTIDFATVWLSNDVLADLTVIDTPGLESTSEASSAATTRLLNLDAGSLGGVAAADAIIYAVTRSGVKADVETLRRLRAQAGTFRLSPVNTVSVLSKADLVATGPDRLETAAAMARQLGETLRDDVAAVVPMVGLLAETTNAERLNESDVRLIQRVATLDERARERLLLSASGFRRMAPLPDGAADRLLVLLGLFGIASAIEYVLARASQQRPVGSADLSDTLARLSGIDDLRGVVRRTFLGRADALKADAGIDQLERLGHHADAVEAEVLGSLRDRLEDVRLDPAMHVLVEVRALRQAIGRRGEVPGALLEALTRLVDGTTDREKVGLDPAASPRDVTAAAQAAIERWRTFAQSGAARPSVGRLAAVTYEGYEILLADVAGTRPSRRRRNAAGAARS